MDRTPLMNRTPPSTTQTLPRSLFAALGACWALALSHPAPANTTYRWMDQNGNPVLSDRPPGADVPYTEVEVGGGFRRYPKPTGINEPDVTQSDATGASLTASTSTSAASPPILIEVVSPQPDLCDQAQDNIFKLETFPRIRVQDEKGAVRFMTDEERSAQLATAFHVRDANCDID